MVYSPFYRIIHALNPIRVRFVKYAFLCFLLENFAYKKRIFRNDSSLLGDPSSYVPYKYINCLKEHI